MKREIVCPGCEKKLRVIFPTESPYPGEHVKFTRGITRKDLICDHCAGNLSRGGEACAVSIWADYGGIPYYQWESEYLNIKT